jgi:hypothetical protein
VGIQAYNPGTWKAEAGELQGGQPELHNELQATLSYLEDPVSKTKPNQNKTEGKEEGSKLLTHYILSRHYIHAVTLVPDSQFELPDALTEP